MHEAAMQVDVQPSTRRFWEEQGQLSPNAPPRMATVYKAEQRPTVQIVVPLRKADYHETALQMTLIRLEQGSPEQAVLAAEKRHQELTESNRRYQGLSP